MADEIEEKIEPVEQSNPRDDVNSDVAAAIASLKEGAAPPVADETDPVEVKFEGDAAPEKTDARDRNPDGTFKTKTEAAPAKVEQPVITKSPPAEDLTKPSDPASPSVAAPVSWAADAKAQWASLPPAIQNAVLKREQEASRGFAQYSEKVRSYEQALAPLAQESQRRGMTTEQGIQRLMDGQRFLEAQPEQAIMWLAQKNGIDLTQLASNPPAAQTQARPDPQFAHVSQTVQSLQERMDSILMDQNMSAVEQFAQSNPFYSEVEDQLPDLMRALSSANPSLKGPALLKEAYDLAIWKNPDVRAKMVEQQQADASRQATEQARAKAAQASKAAVSVKGSSAASAPPKRQEEIGDSVYDAVRASINQLRAS